MRAMKQRGRMAGRWAWRNFRLIAGIALVVGLALALISNREAIAAVDWSIDPWALAAAVALLAIAPLLQALTLGIALRRLGASARRHRSPGRCASGHGRSCCATSRAAWSGSPTASASASASARRRLKR